VPPAATPVAPPWYRAIPPRCSIVSTSRHYLGGMVMSCVRGRSTSLASASPAPAMAPRDRWLLDVAPRDHSVSGWRRTRSVQPCRGDLPCPPPHPEAAGALDDANVKLPGTGARTRAQAGPATDDDACAAALDARLIGGRKADRSPLLPICHRGYDISQQYHSRPWHNSLGSLPSESARLAERTRRAQRAGTAWHAVRST
jgi:hypothetical protein